MEKVIAIVAMLPRTSKARQRLTGVLIDQLWRSLQHPPLSYFGNKYQYRTPDGSYNVSYTYFGDDGELAIPTDIGCLDRTLSSPILERRAVRMRDQSPGSRLCMACGPTLVFCSTVCLFAGYVSEF